MEVWSGLGACPRGVAHLCPSPLSLRFLLHVEEGYSSNPYHSSTHAADVLRTLHVVLTQVRACAEEGEGGGSGL